MRRPHDIPISRLALEVLRQIWPASEFGDLIFPSPISYKKSLSENAFNSALRRMGFTRDEVSAHGFRSYASTIPNENGFNPDVIEAALGRQWAQEYLSRSRSTTWVGSNRWLGIATRG